MSNYRFELGDDYSVSIWDDSRLNEDGSPLIYQPHKPNSDASWDSAEQATEWANDFILNVLSAPKPPKGLPEAPADAPIIDPGI